jgi:peptidoglycan/LPS O-acetylase OafA/YrhL
VRLNYIDVLKAFAIIAVVLYHSGFMTFGYLGVDLFLVINGYLITKSLSTRLYTNNTKAVSEYLGFEISRIVRLLPVLLVAGIVCMALGFWAMLPDDYENLSESVIATNLFCNNILSAITTKNYWDVVNEYKPLMHTWYVGVVMQFYIIYPILFFLAKLDKKNSERTLLVMTSTLAVVSLLIYFGVTDVAQRFYYLPSRFFEFAVGGIVALTWKPKYGEQSFQSWFVYVCYAIILAMMAVNKEIIPANLKLVAVVALSVVLVMSSNTLENKVTGNSVLTKIGAASYSIFVWHQVLLAFYRYTISSHFTIASYSLLIIAVAVLSWLTYQFIEQKTNVWLKEKNRKVGFYTITIILFISLTGFSGYIYQKGGVVRDVPELYISKSEQMNHKSYNDKIYLYNKPFETNKKHWLVVGNSFGRDFANVILESPVADKVELSYIYIDNYRNPEYSERFSSADRIFLSSLGTDEETISEMELHCQINGFDVDKLIIVGTKNFGASNGQFYIKRNRPDYFEQRTRMEKGYMETNTRLKTLYGERYLDLIGLVINEDGSMPVFTPDHHFVSQDCRHFSMGGAKWFATLIDWNKYLRIK